MAGLQTSRRLDLLTGAGSQPCNRRPAHQYGHATNSAKMLRSGTLPNLSCWIGWWNCRLQTRRFRIMIEPFEREKPHEGDLSACNAARVGTSFSAGQPQSGPFPLAGDWEGVLAIQGSVHHLV